MKNILLLMLILLVFQVRMDNMQLSQLLVKMAKGEQLSAGEIQELEQKANVIDAVDSLVSGWVQPGTAIPFIKNLKAENITIPSGEITLGDNVPGESFSGVRIAYPALVYNGENWNLVGVNADVLQVGIRASDGKLLAGGGDVILDSGGIFIKNNSSAAFSLGDPTNTRNVIYILSDTSGFLQMVSGYAHGGVKLQIKLTDNSTPQIKFYEDASLPNTSILVLTTGATLYTGDGGTRLVLNGNTGAGMEPLIDLRAQEDASGSTFMRMRETAVTPGAPSTDAYHMYMKGDKLIIQAGSAKYFYLDLTASTNQSWIYSATAP